MLVLLIVSFKFSPNTTEIDAAKEDPGCIINIIGLPLTEQSTILPRPQIQEIITTDDFEKIEDVDTDIDLTVKLGLPPELEKTSNWIVEEDHVPFFAVEVKQEIVGGLESLLKNVHYAEMAKSVQIKGRVRIGCVVNKTGKAEDANVLKGISGELYIFALNALK